MTGNPGIADWSDDDDEEAGFRPTQPASWADATHADEEAMLLDQQQQREDEEEADFAHVSAPKKRRRVIHSDADDDDDEDAEQEEERGEDTASNAGFMGEEAEEAEEAEGEEEEEEEEEGEEEEEEEEDDDNASESAVNTTVTAPPLLPHTSPLPMPPPTPVFDGALEDIIDFKSIIAPEALYAAGDELHHRWIEFTRQCGPTRMLDCAYRLYEFEPGSEVNDKQLNSREAESVEKMLQLYHRFVTEGLIDVQNKESMAGMRFVRMLELANNMAAIIRLYGRNEIVVDSTVSLGTSMVYKWQLQLTADDEETSRYQKLLLYLLRQAYQRNLRRYNGRFYKQVIVQRAGGPPHRTHAWEFEAEIQEFVYGAVKKENNYEMWLNLTAAKDNVRGAMEYLKNCLDFEVPILVPDRHVFSFKNGLYDATENRFYVYGCADDPIPSKMVAAKYFDIDFPAHLVPTDVDFRTISTPHLDQILDHQKVPAEQHYQTRRRTEVLEDGSKTVVDERRYDVPTMSVRDWFYVFIGRMIYEIGEFDEWQVLMFLKGVAGSGKSTIGKLVSYMYDPSDVGVLSNNTEKKFGLGALVEKLIYICYEVKHDFALDQGEFQCMVSGEQMSIPVKFQTATSVSWKTHGMFMGNEVAAWCDNSGSMSRRIVLGVFNELVTNGNPKLYAELQAEMGYILLKSNRAYREAAAAFGHLDIWKVLPPYFAENRRKLRSETHALAFFLENSADLHWDSRAYISLEDLRMMMNMYLQSEGTFKARSKAFTSDFYQWVFDAYNLRLLKAASRMYKGEVRSMAFVVGLCDRNSMTLEDEPEELEQ